MRSLDLNRIWAETRTEVEPAAFDDVWAGVLARVEAPERRVARAWRSLAVAGLAAAAAVLVACLSFSAPSDSAAPDRALARVPNIHVNPGRILIIHVTPEGTRLVQKPTPESAELAVDWDILNKAGAIP